MIQAAIARTHPAGAEAKLGPESHIPFIMLYLTISIANSLISSSPHLSTAPRRGGMKSGAQTPPDAKAWFAQPSCAYVVFARGALRRGTVPRIWFTTAVGARANLLSGFENQTRVGDDRVSLSIQGKSSRSTEFFVPPYHPWEHCSVHNLWMSFGRWTSTRQDSRDEKECAVGDTRVVLAKLSCVTVEGYHTAVTCFSLVRYNYLIQAAIARTQPAGAEAKLGPESHIPFIMLYPTISIATSLTPTLVLPHDGAE